MHGAHERPAGRPAHGLPHRARRGVPRPLWPCTTSATLAAPCAGGPLACRPASHARRGCTHGRCGGLNQVRGTGWQPSAAARQQLLKSRGIALSESASLAAQDRHPTERREPCVQEGVSNKQNELEALCEQDRQMIAALAKDFELDFVTLSFTRAGGGCGGRARLPGQHRPGQHQGAPAARSRVMGWAAPGGAAGPILQDEPAGLGSCPAGT